MKPTLMPFTPEAFAPFGLVLQPPCSVPDVQEQNQSYWHSILQQEMGDSLTLGFLQIRKQPLVFNAMERHVRNSELFIHTAGRAIMPFAPPTDTPMPNQEEIVFFLLDEATPFLVNQGVWHLPALPFGEKVDFLMALPKDILQDIEKSPIQPITLREEELVAYR